VTSGLHVVFKVADASYIVPASEVLHMESFAGATKVPGTEAHVIGLMQIRQRVVPIIDLRIRFGLPAIEHVLDSRVIVVRCSERTVGLLVDSAREVIDIPADAFGAPPEIVAQRAEGYVVSLAQTGTRLVMLIDLRKVIGEEALRGESE
jgi:purine-binding chemotaxis protein CheW